MYIIHTADREKEEEKTQQNIRSEYIHTNIDVHNFCVNANEKNVN